MQDVPYFNLYRLKDVAVDTVLQANFALPEKLQRFLRGETLRFPTDIGLLW